MIAKFIQDNNFKDQGVNLKGFALNNPYLSGQHQIAKQAQYVYDHGLIDQTKYFFLNIGLQLCEFFIAHEFAWSFDLCNSWEDKLIVDKNGNPKFSPFNITQSCVNPPLCFDYTDLEIFLNREDVQKELNIAGRKWTIVNKDLRALFNTFRTGAKAALESLLQDGGLKILLYFGEQSFSFNWYGGEYLGNSLKWDYSDVFRELPMTKIEGGFHKKLNSFEIRVIEYSGQYTARE